jgi:hypothetical protein
MGRPPAENVCGSMEAVRVRKWLTALCVKSPPRAKEHRSASSQGNRKQRSAEAEPRRCNSLALERLRPRPVTPPSCVCVHNRTCGHFSPSQRQISLQIRQNNAIWEGGSRQRLTSLRGFAPQHIELVSKNEDFDFQLNPRPEQVGQGAPD